MYLFQKYLTKLFLFHQQDLQDQAETEIRWLKSYDTITVNLKQNTITYNSYQY